ncbi:response regulator transcription factor [Thermocoleostomius sinensis]|uniref:Response regulator n=1 Tax=Thermocoleostomius sinensis A174 TaxID=2016057 RepID=A0A9E9C6Y5_9CYAN|nr:response regulator [Thermocoleostomius sinensis]WAL58698.1 response regulator [Thermocoleostomius sinensis A174]
MNQILIAEDEPRIAAFIAKGLLKNGYTVEVASTGAEALQKLQADRFDLLLLDLGLPDKNGWAVLDELQQSHCSLPVIIVSAQVLPPEPSIQTYQTIKAYLSKPFRFSELIETVQTHLV